MNSQRPAPPERKQPRRWPWVLLGMLLALLTWHLWPAANRPGSIHWLPWASDGGVQSRAPGPDPTPAPLESPVHAPRSEPLAPFVGRVVSAWTGAGIAGAEVTFAATEGASSVTTGVDGRFRFVPSHAGSYQLAAVLAERHVPFGPEWGQSPIRLQAPPPTGTPELVVALEPEVEVAGRVEAEDGGTPLPGATVEFRLPGLTTSVAPLERHWTTDTQGRFSGSVAPDGLLVARLAGYLPAATALRGGRAPRQEVTLKLKQAPQADAPERTVAGRVVDPRGAPVPGAVVTYTAGRRGSQWGVAPAPVTTDGEGRFALRGVGEQGSVQARAAEQVSDRVAAPAGAQDLTITVRPGGVLSGRVLHADGTPATAFGLEVLRLRAREPSQTLSVVDPEGRWELRGLGSGVYLLQASAPGAAPSERARVDLPPTENARAERDLRLKAGHRLSGVVKDAQTRAPIPGAQLSVEGAPAEDSVVVQSSVFTGPDGRFTLDGLPETPATVTVEADGHHRKLVSGARAPAEIEVLLRPVEAGQTQATDLVGIGAVVNRSEDGLVVGPLAPGGGAAMAGLHPGDILTRIDGIAVADLGFTDAVQRLRGEEGSVVRVDVRRADGTTTIIDVTRRQVTF